MYPLAPIFVSHQSKIKDALVAKQTSFWDKLSIPRNIGGENSIGARTLKKIVFVGDGLAVAAGLHYLLKARPLATPLSLSLVAKNDSIGPGATYNRFNHPTNLLNNTCTGMSFGDNPSEFLNWAKNNIDLLVKMGYPLTGEITGNDFLPRQFYGKYLEAKVNQLLGQAESSGIKVDVYYENPAVNLSCSVLGDTPFMVTLQKGQSLEADSVYLGTGGFAPRFGRVLLDNPLVQSKDVTYIHAYNEADNVMSHIPQDANIVVIGSSLSAIDVVNFLFPSTDEDNLRTVTLASRTGKLSSVRPAILDKFEPKVFTLDKLYDLKAQGNLNQKSILALMEQEAKLKGFEINILLLNRPIVKDQQTFSSNLYQKLKANIEAIEERDGSNPEVFLYNFTLSVLDNVQKMFSLELIPADEQASIRLELEAFLMNWGAPMPLASAKKLLHLIDTGHIQFLPGLETIESDFSTKSLCFKTKTGEMLHAKYVINATGGGQVEDFSTYNNPLATSMRQSGLAAPYVRAGISLGGLDYEPSSSKLQNAKGETTDNIYLVGQWKKGRQFATNSAIVILEDARIAANAMKQDLEKMP